jgi:acylphosphatase
MEQKPGRKEGSRAVHLRVGGVVQGVGFRYFVVRQAEKLGACGYAMNLDDGDVEVWAEGRPEALESLVAAVRRGPRGSRVDRLEAREAEATGRYSGFGIRY